MCWLGTNIVVCICLIDEGKMMGLRRGDESYFYYYYVCVAMEIRWRVHNDKTSFVFVFFFGN